MSRALVTVLGLGLLGGVGMVWVACWPTWTRPSPVATPPQMGQDSRPHQMRVVVLHAPTTVIPACHPGESVDYRLHELPWRVTITYPVCETPLPRQMLQMTFSTTQPVWLTWDARYQSAGLDFPTWLEGGGRITSLAFWWDETRQAWTLVASSAPPHAQHLPCDQCTEL